MAPPKDSISGDIIEEIYRCSFKKQTGVSLKYMMEFGREPTEQNLAISAQFLQAELPVRLAHRVTELENLPMGLSKKEPITKVRDWYVESFREIRASPPVRTAEDEAAFSALQRFDTQVRIRRCCVCPPLRDRIRSLSYVISNHTSSNGFLRLRGTRSVPLSIKHTEVRLCQNQLRYYN